MADQLLKAYEVDAARLAGVVGKRDATLVDRMLAHPLAREVAASLEGVTLENLLREIDVGALDPAHRFSYRRVLKLIAHVEGTPLAPESIVMPGRGWQDLAPAWKRWRQVALARIWGGSWNGKGRAEPAWPWPRKSAATTVDWPVALLVPPKEAAALRKELDAFDPTVVVERGVPPSIDRFGDPDDWDPEELAEEIEHIASGLGQWLAALAPGNDLLLWHDGQR